MNGPADTTEGAAAAFRRSSRHRAPQRRAREDRWRNDRSARVLYPPGGSPWRRHHGLCRYARCARDPREFEGWSEHDHDRKQNQLHPRGNGRQPRCRRDNAGPPRSAHDGVANARYDNRGKARCDRDANAASAMRPLLELASSPLLPGGITRGVPWVGNCGMGAAPGFVVSLGHLPLAMRFQQREQALAHDESWSIRGHVHLDLTSHVDDGIGIGGLQYLAILLNDGRVPVDQFLRGTVLFSIIAEQDLHQLDAAVVDRGCRIENDMPQPGRVLDIERPAEGHEPGVAHVTLGDGLARP